MSTFEERESQRMNAKLHTCNEYSLSQKVSSCSYIHVQF